MLYVDSVPAFIGDDWFQVTLSRIRIPPPVSAPSTVNDLTPITLGMVNINKRYNLYMKISQEYLREIETDG